MGAPNAEAQHNTIKEHIIRALREDARLWNATEGADAELNYTLLFALLDKVDERVIGLLLKEPLLKARFFVQIEDALVFKSREFCVFMEGRRINNSYTDYKNRIGLTDGTHFMRDTNDVVLNFPYKDCVLEGGQSTEEGHDIYYEYDEDGVHAGGYTRKTTKRKEIFFNQVLAYDEIDRLHEPKAFVRWQRYTKNGTETVQNLARDTHGTITENLIIKGNNYLALHSLKEQFAGKVKLIYIDPPYNTGNDGFKYNDNFNHSTWLVFMKNRLEVARQLLRDDGVMFVQCDDNEQAYLKVLMDEVFGRENFVSDLIWRKRAGGGNDSKHVAVEHEYILFFHNGAGKTYGVKREKRDYKQDKKGHYSIKPLNDTALQDSKGLHYDITLPDGTILRGDQHQWKVTQTKFVEKLRNGEILFKNSKVYYKHYIDVEKNVLPPSIFYTVALNSEATKEMKMLFGEKRFLNPKPEKLLQRIITLTTQPGDIVLDYHLGSGTTAAVAHKMGRQYIGIEQMDYIEDVAVGRLKKVIDGEQGGVSKKVDWQGGGNFIYCELAKWNEAAKERIIACNSTDELRAFFDEMRKRYFLDYNVKVKEFKDTIRKEANFKALSLDQQKQIYAAMLDNNQLYIPHSEMADAKYAIGNDAQVLTREFYGGK